MGYFFFLLALQPCLVPGSPRVPDSRFFPKVRFTRCCPALWFLAKITCAYHGFAQFSCTRATSFCNFHDFHDLYTGDLVYPIHVFSQKSVLHDVAPHYGFCPKSHARTMVLPSFRVPGRPDFAISMTFMTCTRVTSGTRFTFFPESPFYTMLPRTMVFGQNHMRVPWFRPVFMYTGDLIFLLA